MGDVLRGYLLVAPRVNIVSRTIKYCKTLRIT